MGYTHYWRAGKNTKTSEANEVWGKVLEAAGAIVRSKLDIVQLECDDPSAPETGDGIVFNGIEDDGHETFVLPSNSFEISDFDFCKTAQKPYDVVVTAVLATMKFHMGDAFVVSSDGSASDWLEGIQLAREITGDPIGLPASEDDWVSSYEESYQQQYRKDYQETMKALI